MAPVAAAPIATLASGHLQAYGDQKLNAYVVSVAILAASGGLLFGYDLGITGGVESNSQFLEEFFPDVYAAEQSSDLNGPYCTFNSATLQFFTSVLFLAGLIFSPIASYVSDKRGRLVSMFIAAVFFLIGAGLNAGAQDLAMLYIGRCCLGAGIGFANASVPVYLSEAAPFRYRGALNQLFQLATTIGIFVAQLVNYGVRNWAAGWRLSLGLAAVPALVLLVGSLVLPESPNSLYQRGHVERAEQVLKRLRKSDDVSAELEDIREATMLCAKTSTLDSWRQLGQRKNLPQLTISILIPLFQQFTGINAIMFYVPVLFKSLGSGAETALLNTVIIGCVNVVSTLVAIFSVDRLGRRFWFLEGGVQMCTSMIVVSAVLGAGFSSGATVLPEPMSIGVLVVICVFVAAFAWSWGPLGWLVPSEVHALSTRTAGMSVAVSTNFLFSFVIGQTFISMLCAMEWGVFLFFAGFVVIMSVFVYFFVVETRHVPVERVPLLFARHHLWKKLMGAEATEEIENDFAAATQASKDRALEDGDTLEQRRSSTWQVVYPE